MVKVLVGLCVAIYAIIMPLQAVADTYPGKPINLILGFAAGGSTDVIGRTLAQRLSIQLDVPVVVHNRSGADSLLASQAVKNAAPDGYTIYLASSAHAINQSLFNDPKFDALDDFTPISKVGHVPNVIVISPNLPTKTLSEFIDYAKERKGALNYATTASVTYLETALMLRSAGLDLQRVSYKGASPASLAIMSGDVHLMISGIGPMVSLIEADRVRGLAVTSAKRSALLPELPTAMESGMSDYTSSVWYALLAPANVPSEIVARLNDETRKALDDPKVAATLAAQGVEVQSSSPGELHGFLQAEVAKWQKVVAEIGVPKN